MEVIENNGKISCIVYRDSDWVEGLNFITPDEMYIQAGSWWYSKGKVLDKHVHNDFDRVATRTQETVYVRRGSMRVSLYSEELTLFKEFVLNEGELAIFGWGGHGYEILEDDTQIIETKNGPFTGVENDKVKF
ncbi:hypothetical protein N9X85_05055 [Luminiphilus sp.]|nr:hypothetical protein [Luminiphilus sp.]